MMLDIHAQTSTGNTATALTNSGGTGNVGTIALGGDGATIAGLPIDTTKNAAKLIMWGGMTTIADTIEDIQLYAQDQWDNVNGEWFTPGASSLIGLFSKETYLPYAKGRRIVSMQQNTGAANNLAFMLDLYEDTGKAQCVMGELFPANSVIRTGVFGAALTAQTWGTTAWAPAAVPPDGKYALLGVYPNALTNYAVMRFTHNDFGQYSPGFPIVDQTNSAVANAVLPKYSFFTHQGWQFATLSRMANRPLCPVFTIKSGTTGLTIDALSITACTPVYTLNLQALE